MLEKSIKKIIIPSIRALLKKAMLLFFVILNPAVEIVVKFNIFKDSSSCSCKTAARFKKCVYKIYR